MVKLVGIYTIRDSPHPYYWDVVYEWEDELSKALNLPLIPVGREYDKIYKPSLFKKILNRLNYYQRADRYLFNPEGYYLAFHIGPPGIYSFHSRKDVIPIIIDFWKYENLRRFESIFSLNKIVFVTSKEVHNYLLDCKIKVKLDHLALSLPDKLMVQSNEGVRKFDIIQMGRQNVKLTDYIKRLLDEYPEITYVYGEKTDGKLRMISTRHGNLGEFNDRDSFLALLRQTKVSLLSAPGLDSDAERTGGFSPVTPRFLESAACGCHLMGVYPLNDDFIYYGIDQICVNIDGYENFKTLVLSYLKDQRTPAYRKFLQSHATSNRAFELIEKISSHYA
jgi:hypothetical protein